MKFIFRNPKIFILLLLIFGFFLRFYNLNWGTPYYFHPDERNIASSVSQLKFPDQMNPNFFAYGSLPIYSIFKLGLIKNLVFYCLPGIKSCLSTSMTSFHFISDQSWEKFNHLSFDDAIIISRLFSASFSCLLIILIYHIGKKFHSIQTGLIAALLTTTSVGLIQFSHFGTFEIWLTFFSVLLFVLSLKILNEYRIIYVFLSGLIMGILISIKISHVILLPIPIACVIIVFHKMIKSSHSLKEKINIIFEGIVQLSVIIIIAISVFFVTNPYVILDNQTFKNSISYESKVAMGTLDVFYTHEFFDTIPVIYQFLNVYPFLLNPLITVLFIPALFYLIYNGIKTKNHFYLLLSACYLVLFLSQAFLFVKWTRYMIPTLPFIYLITAIALVELFIKVKWISNVKYQILSIISIISLFFTFSYFLTVFADQDSRVKAAKWAESNINLNSNILSESYDLGIIAFDSNLENITLCDMYYLENNSHPCNGFSFNESLKDAEFIILPSERVLKMSLINKDRFPKRYQIYSSLLNDKHKYKLIYKTPCDIYCKITYLGSTLYPLEQTTHVFDRPTVYILESINQ